MLKQAQYKIQGMQQDLSASAFKSEYSFENHNIRISSRGNNTLLSVTNEKGNIEAPFKKGVFRELLLVDSEIHDSDIWYIFNLSGDDDFTTQLSITYSYRDVDNTIKYADYNIGSVGTKERGVLILPSNTPAVRFYISPGYKYGSIEDGTHIYYTEHESKSCILGDYVGHCIINNTVVIFSSYIIPDEFPEVTFIGGSTGRNISNIISFTLEDNEFTVKKIYAGDLNLQVEYPIDSLGIYENENIQKVYWTDNINPVRFLNLKRDYSFLEGDCFDFNTNSPELKIVEVKKNDSGIGVFASGTIQYAFTYAVKNGQETGITALSSINYIAPSDRGASPEEKITTSFNISFEIPSTSISPAYKFDFVKIYSIHRTSLNGTPTVKEVFKIPISETYKKISVTDTGNIGSIVDPTLLLYLGATGIAAKTITQKDNTLFLGGISYKETLISQEIKKEIKDNSTISFKYKNTSIPSPSNSFYPYKSTLAFSRDVITTFKSREWYRFGIQLQYKSGKWSDVIWVGDKRCNLHPKYEDTPDGKVIKLVGASVTINKTDKIVKFLNNYRTIRGVIVYPDASTCEVVCQGVLNPTVYNIRDRKDNSPFAQASWFFRNNDVSGIECRHNVPLKSGYILKDFEDFAGNYIASEEVGDYYAEIQSMTYGNTLPEPYISTGSVGINKCYNSNFFVDQSIITLNSPDIEFSDNKDKFSNDNLKLRIVGTIPLSSTSKYSIGSTDTRNANNDTSTSNIINYKSVGYGSPTPIGFMWYDLVSTQNNYNGPGNYKKDKRFANFLVYPWHRQGSLNNFPVPVSDKQRLSKLKRKVFSTLRVSEETIYTDIPLWDATGNILTDSDNGYITTSTDKSTGISPVRVFDNASTPIVKIPSPLNSDLSEITYYGDIDTILSDFGNPNASGSYKEIREYSYSILAEDSIHRKNQMVGVYETVPRMLSKITKTYVVFDPTINDNYLFGNDPIPMAYKSSPHAVFALNYTQNKQQRVLPIHNINYKPNVGGNNKVPFWDKNTSHINDPYVSYDIIRVSNYKNFLYLGELYRDTNADTRFGGNTQSALEQNSWVVAGQSEIELPFRTNTLEINYTEGDTYYQRYDCLKTYSHDDKAVNNIVEILSFMCETRFNIDGRYDRNRGQQNNTMMSPLNFNLFNPSYTQYNNFFNYKLIDSARFSLSNFSNSILWSKTKVFGEEIDSWVNLPLTSIMSLDGNKGNITALRKHNNEIFCFQPTGISRILYNSRAQMATISEGNASVPVELSNSGKVEGKVYISEKVGSSNQKSIIETISGLYFIDDLSSNLYLLNSEGISNISRRNAFSDWVNKIKSTEPWNASSNPDIGFKNTIAFYDSIYNDVYFITNSPNTTATYSEVLGQFTSFFDYNNVPSMFNLGEHFISLKDGKLWFQNEGEYNSFFNEKKPYSIELLCNPNALSDKTFNTVEWLANIKEGNIDSQRTFNSIRVVSDNNYQDTGDVNIINTTGKPSVMLNNNYTTLKRKFRMWRTPIPRDKSNHRDRIRSPWVKIKLAQNNPSNESMELHNIAVSYFE